MAFADTDTRSGTVSNLDVTHGQPMFPQGNLCHVKTQTQVPKLCEKDQTAGCFTDQKVKSHSLAIPWPVDSLRTGCASSGSRASASSAPRTTSRSRWRPASRGTGAGPSRGAGPRAEGPRGRGADVRRGVQWPKPSVEMPIQPQGNRQRCLKSSTLIVSADRPVNPRPFLRGDLSV